MAPTKTTTNDDWAIDIGARASGADSQREQDKYTSLQWLSNGTYIKDANEDHEDDVNKANYSGWFLEVGRNTDLDHAMADAGTKKALVVFQRGTTTMAWILGNVTVLPVTGVFDTYDGRNLDLWTLAQGKEIYRKPESNIVVGWKPKRETINNHKTIVYKPNGSPQLISFFTMPVILITSATASKKIDYLNPVLINFDSRSSEHIVKACAEWQDVVLPQLVSDQTETGAAVRKALGAHVAEYDKDTGTKSERKVNLRMVAMPLGCIGTKTVASAEKVGESAQYKSPGIVMPKKLTPEWAASLVVPVAVRLVAEGIHEEVHEWAIDTTIRRIKPDEVTVKNFDNNEQRPVYMAAPPTERSAPVAPDAPADDERPW